MKKIKLQHKMIAIVLTTVFTFQSMSQINEHTYKIGLDNIHIHGGCLVGLDYSDGCFDSNCIFN
tara:strand:+ start:2034 stop:2225 length:192 start_codon:yes stop_codon:yes gene_type:complete